MTFSEDYWLIRDESPDKWNWYDQIVSAFEDLGAAVNAILWDYKPSHPAPLLINQQQAGILKKLTGGDDLSPNFVVFTDEMSQIDGPPGTDTHDDRGRPLLDSSGGPRRPTRVCPRHGKLMPHGRCPKCG